MHRIIGNPLFFSPPFYGVTVGTLSGTGHDTLRSLEVVRPLLRDRLEGNWLDGRPNSTRLKEDGDGDVLVESSQIEGAQNITLPLDHGALMANPQGVNTILSFLSGESLLLPLETRTTRHQDISIQNDNASALLIIVQGARATLTDNFGFSEQDSDGQITIIDPHDEPFTLTVQPNRSRWLWWKPKYKIIVAQLFEDGTSIWKEYPQRGSAQKKWNLRFDRKGHNNNILSN